MIRNFSQLLKHFKIYYKIPLKLLKGKVLGIDGNFFVKEYVDTSFRFSINKNSTNHQNTIEKYSFGLENVRKMISYLKNLEINILWVWSNTHSECLKCSENISFDVLGKILQEEQHLSNIRVNKKNKIDEILIKNKIQVIKAPGLASAQLVDAYKENVINFIYADEETLLFDKCGYLISNLNPIFSDYEYVPVFIKSRILKALKISGKMFSYLCMSLGNLYCPTHPIFKNNFDSIKIYDFVVTKMYNFTLLKEMSGKHESVYKKDGANDLCENEKHLWFLKFLYAENIFYRMPIYKERGIGCLSNIKEIKKPFKSLKELMKIEKGNPLYNENFNENIKCQLCFKEIKTDLMKGYENLIKIFEKSLFGKAETKEFEKNDEYLKFLISKIICEEKEFFEVSPLYKLILILLKNSKLEILKEDLRFIKKYEIKEISDLNFSKDFSVYKKKYRKFLENFKNLKIFLNFIESNSCNQENCNKIFLKNEKENSINSKKSNEVCFYCLSHEFHLHTMSLENLIKNNSHDLFKNKSDVIRFLKYYN